MNLSDITIETKNLLLKSISMDYKEEMFKEFTSEITTFMFPKTPEKIEDTIKFIETTLKERQLP